jgi:hypothetical protein
MGFHRGEEEILADQERDDKLAPEQYDFVCSKVRWWWWLIGDVLQALSRNLAHPGMLSGCAGTAERLRNARFIQYHFVSCFILETENTVPLRR